MQQLLWLEMLTKGLLGIGLLAAPGVLARIAGLAAPGASFWPRLAGILLVGVAASCLISGNGGAGIGAAGLAALNIATAFFLAAHLALKPHEQARRGAALLWLAAGLLILLALFEIAHV